MAPTEISVGLNKGHKVTKNTSKPKVVRRKGVSFISNIIYIRERVRILDITCS